MHEESLNGSLCAMRVENINYRFKSKS